VSRWTEFEFEFEASDGERFMVSGQTASEGTYDEPFLGLDGDIMLRSLRSDAWRALGDVSELSAEDRRRLEGEVDREIDRLIEAYASDISQDMYESAVDHAYETLREREWDRGDS